MKTYQTGILAVALFFGAVVIADARCFLPFFCFHPARHQAVRPAPVDNSAASPFCKGIKNAFAKSRNADEEAFVAAFPESKRDRVRDCLG